MTIRFGWDITNFSGAIKQGSTGSIKLTATVTQEDGSALPTYDGWTAALKLFRTQQATAPDITQAPTVTGDAANKRLIFTISFVPNDTKALAVGTLIGDLLAIDPAGTSDYYPANISLAIERSYTLPA